MAGKSQGKRPSAASRGKAKSRGRRAAPEYTTSPLIRSVALIALGALMTLGATAWFDAPGSLSDPLPRLTAMAKQFLPRAEQRPAQASVARNPAALPHTQRQKQANRNAKSQLQKQAERARMPATRAEKSPDRSIETAAIPVPRPPKPLADARKPAEAPKSAAMRPPREAAPRPPAGVPNGAEAQKAALPGAAAPKSERVAGLAFPICGEGPGKNCIIDADTFVLNGKAYRVADIEVPLAADPKCRREAMLADKAKRRLQALLNAGPIELRGAGPDQDVYGRKLRTVHRDGRSLGATLISEGLARPAGGGKGWCT